MNLLKSKKALTSLVIALLIIAVIVIVIGAIFAFIYLFPGNMRTEELSFTDFNALDVSSAFEVDVRESDIYSVKITAGERVFDRILVTQSGETLKIEVAPGFILGPLNAKAEITMPSLENIMLSGACKGTVDGFSDSAEFVIRVSGASSLDITNTEVGDVDVELSGASRLTAQGAGSDLISTVSGASNMDLSNFQVDDANVVLSGASHAVVYPNGTLNVDASGASSLEYIGEPALGNINTSGASSVNKR